MLLWQEYRAGAPEVYGYSRFCELYDEWESRLSPTMRQEGDHLAQNIGVGGLLHERAQVHHVFGHRWFP